MELLFRLQTGFRIFIAVTAICIFCCRAVAQTPRVEQAQEQLKQFEPQTRAYFLAKLKETDAWRVCDLNAASICASEATALAEALGGEDLITVARTDEIFVNGQLHGRSKAESKLSLLDLELHHEAAPELQLHFYDAKILTCVWSNDGTMDLEYLLTKSHQFAKLCEDRELVAQQNALEVFARTFHHQSQWPDSSELKPLVDQLRKDAKEFPTLDCRTIRFLTDSRLAKRSKNTLAQKRCYNRALYAANETGNLYYVARTQSMLAIAEFQKADFDDAGLALRSSIQAAHRLGSEYQRFEALNQLALVNQKRGLIADQRRCLERASKLAAFTSLPIATQNSVIERLEWICNQLNDPVQAQVYAAKVIDIEDVAKSRKSATESRKKSERINTKTALAESEGRRADLEKQLRVSEQKVNQASTRKANSTISFFKKYSIAASCVILVLAPWLLLYGYRLKFYKIRDELDVERINSLESQKQCQDLSLRISRMERMESLGLMAGCIAHDFNNILVGVLCNAEILQMEDSFDDKQFVHKRVAAIVKSAEKAASLSTQMLAYAGRQNIARQETDLNELVHQYEPILESVLQSNQTLHFELDTDRVITKVDITQIEQVLLNLVTNAAEASPRDSTIVIRTGTTQIYDIDDSTLYGTRNQGGRFGFIEVQDEGEGIPQSALHRIFEPFFTQSEQGRGLGLSVVYGVINGHDGIIQCVTQPDKGTMFRALLPHLETDPEDLNLNTSSIVSESAIFHDLAETIGTRSIHCDKSRSKTVLVCDDEESIVELCKQSLERMDYKVFTAGAAMEALQILEEHGDEIDCILIDVVMPRMGANEFLTEIEKSRIQTPVVLMSGFSSTSLEFFLSRPNVVSFVQKPFRIANLQTILGEIIEVRSFTNSSD